MNPFKRKIIKLILCRRILKRKKTKPKKFHIRSIFLNRLVSGESILVREMQMDPEYHKKYFRMTKENFDHLLTKIRRDITHERKHICPISATERLAITLRFLASGNSQISLAMSYRISPAAVSKILRETMFALCSHLEEDHLPTPSTKTWTVSENGFCTRWQFPNCCGALDGKHIRIQAPKLSGSMHYNYKGYFSIVLMAIVDPYYRFSVADIGSSGSISDGGVFARSGLGAALHNNSLTIPAEKKVGTKTLPHVIVADDAFPLRKNLLKPFSGKALPEEKRIFNYRLSRARMVVECAFGILASRWRILNTAINAELEFSKLIVKTCVVLHNFLIDKSDSTISIDATDDFSESMLTSVHQQGSNNYSSSAALIRSEFMKYFNEEGEVSWQKNCI